MKGFRKPPKMKVHGCCALIPKEGQTPIAGVKPELEQCSKPIYKKGLCAPHHKLHKQWKATQHAINQVRRNAVPATGQITITGFDETSVLTEEQIQGLFSNAIVERVPGTESEGQEGSGVESEALHVDEHQSDRGDRGLGSGLLPGEHGEVHRPSQVEERSAGLAEGTLVLDQEAAADGEGKEPQEATDPLTEEEQMADAKEWHRTHGDRA